MIPSLLERAQGLFSGIHIESGGEMGNLYEQLMSYYKQNFLYDSLMSQNYYLGTWHESMQPLRNPANRSVEFYVSKLMPGVLPDALPIVTDNQKIVEPVHDVWEWSNLSTIKQPEIRKYAIYGDAFIHSVANPQGTKVYLQFILPQFVTDFNSDHRGFIQDIRVDIPIGNGKIHTEYWNDVSYSIWEHRQSASTPLDRLDGLVDEGLLSDFGIDFCPFVHAKFKDVGDTRGWGAYTHCLEKIDEANRMATRLNELLFRYNKAHWAVSSNSSDASGRPLPAPKLSKTAGDAQVKDDSIYYLPGMATMQSLIPDIKYADALAILQDHMAEIEKDLPELAYYRLREKGELSGRAVRLLLGDAIDRANEARANWESALIRAENMCLSIGQTLGIWNGLGTFDAGDFDHSYARRDIFPVSQSEKAETLKSLTDAGIPMAQAVKMAGFTDDEIALISPVETPKPVVPNVTNDNQQMIDAGNQMMDNLSQ